MSISLISNCLPNLEKSFLKELESCAKVQDFNAKDYIVKQGQYIKYLPIVLKGEVKIFSIEENTQFLLYYISSGDPCIFSFAHILDTQKSEFSAISEVDSRLLLLPTNKVEKWLLRYPSFNKLILNAYQHHYKKLLEATKQINCYNLEDRLLQYFTTKAKIQGSNLLDISHQDIANDLGTSREVISRLMKKPNVMEKALQEGRKIKVL